MQKKIYIGVMVGLVVLWVATVAYFVMTGHNLLK